MLWYAARTSGPAANAGYPEDGVAPRAQAATATPIGQRRPRRGSQLSPQPAKQRPGVTENLRHAEHRDIGVSTNGNRVGSPGGYVRGKQEIFEPLPAVPQTRTIRPSLTSLHNYA
jgi:hypothetical protein